MLICGDKACAYLAARDARMGEAIARIGRITRGTDPDVFASLTRQIVGQQISNAAYTAVVGRLEARAGRITPQSVLSLGADGLRACGMSMTKAQNILAAADAFLSGDIDAQALGNMPDAEVIAALTALRGVGVWTAEMLLIFCFARPDVMSFGDLGIRRGLMRLHGLETLTAADFRTYRALYSPCGTTASLYLWAIAAEAVT